MSFYHKIIWITGASSGIGKALALELAAQKAKIIISSRNITQLEAVKKLCKYPDNVRILPLDLEKHAQLSCSIPQK